MASNFVPTNAGLAAATLAVGGPRITIGSYVLGDGLVPPSPNDVGLSGLQVYSGTTLQVVPVGSDTVDVVITIPASAGPFEFGEIGLNLTDGTFFARGTYVAKQEKLSSLTTGVGATFNIHCLLKLAHANAVLNFNFTTLNEIPIMDGSAVVGPDTIDATVNQIIARIPTPQYSGNTPIPLTRMTGTRWNPVGYDYRGVWTLPVGASSTSIPNFTPVIGAYEQQVVANNVLYQYLLQGPNGNIVTASLDAGGTLTLAYPCAWVTAGAAVFVYSWNGTRFNRHQSAYLAGVTSYEPTPGGVRHQIGFMSPYFQLPFVGIDYSKMEGTTIKLVTDVTLPFLPDTKADSTSNDGFTLSFYNTDSSAHTISVSANMSFILVGEQTQLTNASVKTIAPRGRVTCTYLKSSASTWTVLIDGSGIYGFNYGGQRPIGEFAYFDLSIPPPGWKVENNDRFNNADYPEAYLVYGDQFRIAGDPVGTFRIPEARGETVISMSNGRPGITPMSLNEWKAGGVGQHTHQLQVRGSSNDNGDPGPLVNTNFAGVEDNGINALHADSKALATGLPVENTVRRIAKLGCVYVGRP